MKIKLATLAILLLSVSLFGCGSDEDTAKAAKTAAPVVKEAAPVDPTAKMARAVPSSKSGAAIELKYDVLSKPETGKPIEIDLALIPSSLLDSISVNVTATPGLEIVTNATGNFGVTKIGEVTHHLITVRADHADVVYLTVAVTVNAVGVNSARTFAIPLIVSDPGAPEAQPAAKDAANIDTKTDSAGQKVQSMPAK